MGDNPTQETPDSRSFEERVFARFDNLDGRLTALEDKVDSRLRETRPIWEAVQAQLGDVQTQLGDVKNRMEGLEKDFKAVRRSIMLLHEDNLLMRGDLRELLERAEKLDGRVEKLESQSTR